MYASAARESKTVKGNISSMKDTNDTTQIGFGAFPDSAQNRDILIGIIAGAGFTVVDGPVISILNRWEPANVK